MVITLTPVVIAIIICVSVMILLALWCCKSKTYELIPFVFMTGTVLSIFTVCGVDECYTSKERERQESKEQAKQEMQESAVASTLPPDWKAFYDYSTSDHDEADFLQRAVLKNMLDKIELTPENMLTVEQCEVVVKHYPCKHGMASLERKIVEFVDVDGITPDG